MHAPRLNLRGPGNSAELHQPAELYYRPDIDGLRAIAILSVLAFHAAPRLVPGGFVGVDIFFVISGYLIARMILAEIDGGTFSFAAFYARRARRLFPALVVVAAATWICGWFLFLPDEFASLGRHMVAGAGFASNLLINSEVGYFDAPAATKPLLHLWSLGVEEQFYIAFPALLYAVARRRAALAAVVAIGLVGSFALNIATIRSHPAFAFYFPATRLWEFLLGAALARDELPGGRQAAAFVGAALMLTSNFLVRESAFPGWWALLPAIGAALVIGGGPDTIVNRALGSRVLVFVGLISYPLYLWHWPLLVFARTISQGAHERLTTFLAIALAFVLAWLTWRFVERPVRARRPKAARLLVTAACTCCLGLLALVGLATSRDGLPDRYPDAIRNFLLPRAYADDFAPVPPLGSPGNANGPLVAVWGDSHADHLMPGLQRLQHDRTFRLVGLRWWDECPPDGTGLGDAQRCPIPGRGAMNQLRTMRPDIVIVSAFWYQYNNRAEKIDATLTFLQRIGVPRVVVVGPSPFWPHPTRVLLYTALKIDPRHQVPDRLTWSNPSGEELDREVGGLVARFGATYLSPRAFLCDGDGCLTRIGNAAKDLVQVDNSHYTAAGSWFVVSHFASMIFD